MNRVLVSILLMYVTVPLPAGAQESITLLATQARLADYGIASARDVVRGRLSVAHAPDGPRLGVYFLRDSLPTAQGLAPEPSPLPPPPTGREDGERSSESALWVWNTRQLIHDARERDAFLRLVETQGIRWVFLYLTAEDGAAPAAGFVPFDADGVGALVADLGDRGVGVYGLDGDPAYALPENHAGVLRTVAQVAEHNRTAPEDQRLAGVRFDVEPYLLPGFQGPRRQEILDGYVALVAALSEAATEAGLALGLDIPFWLDSPDEETGEPLRATLDGERRPVLAHLMALVDDVAIMDYRTRAYGVDGAVIHAVGELELGAARGVGVFVGVETTALVDEELHTFSGPGDDGLPPSDGGAWVVMAPVEGGAVRLWLVEGEDEVEALGRELGDPGVLRHWPAGPPVLVSADKQSFFSLGPDIFESETARIVRALSPSPAFLGLAYHDYRGLKRLMEGR